MKRISSISILVVALLAVACGGPRVIPDKKLGQIFHDALIANAYLDVNSEVKIDSINIYEPILADYGYTVEDLQYTIRNFSRRKSARLSDVAEYTILLLAREAEEYNKLTTKLDTIDNVARRHFTHTLMHYKDIKIEKEADTVLLRYRFPVSKHGEYRVQATYTLDSLDKHNGRRYRVRWVRRDSLGYMPVGSGVISRRANATFNYLGNFTPDEEYEAIEIEFDFFPGHKGKKPFTRMNISELKITYTPPLKESVQALFDEQSGMRIFSDSLISSIEAAAVAGDK